MTHACQRFGNVHEKLRLPRFSQHARIPCTCHVNSRFWPPHVTDSLHLPCKMKFMPENVHEHPVKRRLRKCDFWDANFECACAVEINIESQNGIPAQTKPPAQSEHLNEHPAFTLTVRTPQCSTLFGEKHPEALHSSPFLWGIQGFQAFRVACQGPSFQNSSAPAPHRSSISVPRFQNCSVPWFQGYSGSPFQGSRAFQGCRVPEF